VRTVPVGIGPIAFDNLARLQPTGQRISY